MRGHTLLRNAWHSRPHISETEMDHARRWSCGDDALRKIGVLGDDGEVVCASIFPQDAIGRRLAQDLGVDDGKIWRELYACRQVAIEQEAVHATASIEYALPISRDA